jgi:hypothetical protein
MGYEDSMNLYQAFGMNPVTNRDPWGLKTDFNYFGTTKTYGEALRSLVITDADRRLFGRIAEGGANIIPGVIYWLQDAFETITGEDYFEEDWRFYFNFSEPGSVIQIYKGEYRSYFEKLRDATIVYPTGKFLADTGSNFILGYNDPYVMNTPVGQEARENFDRQLIPLAATGYGVYKGISLKSPKYRPEKLGFEIPYDRFAGVKEASKLLRDEGVPRKYRVEALQSFKIDTIKVRKAGGNEYGIRFYDNIDAFPKGRTLFETFPASIEGLAVKWKWNKMKWFKQFRIREGALIIEGRISSQGKGLPGGLIQKYILDPLRDLIE